MLCNSEVRFSTARLSAAPAADNSSSQSRRQTADGWKNARCYFHFSLLPRFAHEGLWVCEWDCDWIWVWICFVLGIRRFSCRVISHHLGCCWHCLAFCIYVFYADRWNINFVAFVNCPFRNFEIPLPYTGQLLYIFFCQIAHDSFPKMYTFWACAGSELLISACQHWKLPLITVAVVHSPKPTGSQHECEIVDFPMIHRQINVTFRSRTCLAAIAIKDQNINSHLLAKTCEAYTY